MLISINFIYGEEVNGFWRGDGRMAQIFDDAITERPTVESSFLYFFCSTNLLKSFLNLLVFKHLPGMLRRAAPR